MGRKRVLELLILVLALPALYLAQLGCEGIEQPEPAKNKEPETVVTSGPVDSTDAFYRVPVFWKGFDDDGLIQGFEYALDDTLRSDWVFTTRSDSEFVFLTALDAPEEQLQRRFHRFFVRAIDNEGKEDLTPAWIEFFAETQAAPRSILLRDIAYRVAVSDSKVFVAGGENGLDIYDVSDPLAIDHVKTLFTGGVATDILMHDGVVFIGDGEKGVTVIDVTLPENASIIGRYPTLGAAAAGIAFDDPYLAVADGTNGVVILDVSTPEDPLFVARYTPENSEEFVGVAIHGDRVVGLAGEDGVFLFEFRPEASSLRLNPLPEGSPQAFVTWNQALYALVEDGFILVADGAGGLLILEVGADGTMTEYASVPLEGRARALERYGDFLFVANGNNGVSVIDVTDRAAPELVDRFG